MLQSLFCCLPISDFRGNHSKPWFNSPWSCGAGSAQAGKSLEAGNKSRKCRRRSSLAGLGEAAEQNNSGHTEIKSGREMVPNKESCWETARGGWWCSLIRWWLIRVIPRFVVLQLLYLICIENIYLNRGKLYNADKNVNIYNICIYK